MSEQSPDIASDVSETANSIEQQADDLREYREYITEARERVADMAPREREAFYEKAAGIQSELDTIQQVDDLLALEDEIEEAVRSPLRQAALSALDEFLAVVDPELTDETGRDVRQQVEGSVPTDLEKITDTYQQLIPLIDDLSPLIQELVADRIERHPTELTNPGPDLLPYVERLESRYDQLETFEAAFEEAGAWAPAMDLTETKRFYSDLKHRVDREQGQKAITTIDEEVAAVDNAGLNVADLVQAELSRELETAKIDDVVPTLKEAVTGLSTLRDDYQTATRYADILDQFGTNRGVFEERIDELLAAYEQLGIQVYNSVSALKESIRELNNDFLELFKKLSDRLNAQREMVDDIREEFNELDPPEVEFATERTASITTSTVVNDLYNAMEASATYDTWIENAFEELGGETFDTDEAIDIWRQLYDGKSVRLTEENREAVLALADRFTIDLVLGSE